MSCVSATSDSQELPPLYPIGVLLQSDDRTALPGCREPWLSALRRVATWSVQYLTNPHPELGRNGPVCPWVKPTIRAGRYFFAALSTEDDERTDRAFFALGRHFLAMEPTRGAESMFKTIVVVFPDLALAESARIIDVLHQRLKPFFVENGLMLGDFYPTCPKLGLHNPQFRPLQSSIPLIVIRTMVAADVAFLNESELFMRHYYKKFPRVVPIDPAVL